MSQQKTAYNQIDFVIKAPKFRIVFSYMDDTGVAFVREYVLRLLKLTPCKPEQIAQYFGFNQQETQIALDDLEKNNWIIWQDDGLIALSNEGKRLFLSAESQSPLIPALKEFAGEYRMELLDNNFLLKKDCDNKHQNAIELNIEPKVLSESQEIVRKTFQNRFRQLIEDDIIDLNGKEIALYKIDAIEPKGKSEYFRFTQAFELLPTTGDTKKRHDIANIIHQDNIQQAITAKIVNFSKNIKELRQRMSEIGDDDTLKVLFGGRLDFNEFLAMYKKYDEQNGVYFLGQIYHQDELFEKINEIIKNMKKQSHNLKKCYWLAPSDIYWAKQRKIYSRLENLISQSKEKYDFRLYLPLPSERYVREKQEWQNEFRDILENHLYGFCEGFLNGNTEILFLENEFALICYHAKLNAYPVTLPIGFMTTDKAKIKHIQNLVENYLSQIQFADNEDDDNKPNDFGQLKSL